MPENSSRSHFRRRSPTPARSRDLRLLGALILLNVAAYLAQEIFGLQTLFIRRGGISLAALRDGAPWTAVTHLFVHRGWGHLLFNMILLAFAGRSVLAAGGRARFAALYLLSGVTGAAASLFLEPRTLLVGASGAVCGIVGAWAALNPEKSVTDPIHRIVPWRLRAKFVFAGCLAVAVALEIARHFLLKSGWSLPLIDGVAHSAHAAGLLTGWLYARRLPAAGKREFPWRREEFFPQGLRRRRREEESWRPFGPPDPEEFPLDTVPWNAGMPAGSALPPPKRSDDEFLREEVDPVLDKLYAAGMQSLTPEERRILDRAAAVIARKSRN